jgi:hypothetical protein
MNYSQSSSFQVSVNIVLPLGREDMDKVVGELGLVLESESALELKWEWEEDEEERKEGLSDLAMSKQLPHLQP